jgi:Ricin-type beta-trefoil lectin domain-like
MGPPLIPDPLKRSTHESEIRTAGLRGCAVCITGGRRHRCASRRVTALVPPPPSGWTDYGFITLSVEASHKCLDADTNGGGANGSKVQIWDCNDLNQQWWDAYKNNATGGFAFVNARFGKCLDQDTNTYARNGGKV